MIHLSKLKNLEALAIRKSSGTITDVGFQALKDLPKLKEAIVINGDLTLDQLQTLERLLPNVAIRVN